MKSASPKRFRDIPTSLLARAVVLCVLVCIGVSLVGLPVVRPASEKSSEAFPCMDSPCGCATAAQCWDRCCCNTDAEKLAWAKKHDVQPPAFLVQRFAVACSTAKSASKSCCCSKSSNEKQAEEKANPAKIRIAVWQSIQKCRGVDLILNLLGCCWTPLGESETLDVEPPIVGDATPINDLADSLALSIDPPVPLIGSLA